MKFEAEKYVDKSAMQQAEESTINYLKRVMKCEEKEESKIEY